MIVCPSCQNLINEENFHREYHSEGINKTYKLYICEKCDLGFWYPLEFVEEIYSTDLLNIGYTVRIDIIRENPYPIYHPNHILGLKHLKKSKDYLSGNKLLDIGCGTGMFLREAKKIGFDVYGVDLDKGAITVAKDIFKIENVMLSSFDNFFEKEASGN
ncbi:MAG: class I SAM-dependent methyltransferase [Spirochaetes bacterium]|nr:class I SAM-dependent methyltransferase [Spirochaetota bacterium]